MDPHGKAYSARGDVLFKGDGYPWAPILSDCRGNGSTKLNLKIDAVYKRNAA
jgi:hypothetical protein